MATGIERTRPATDTVKIPRLCAGDRLSRAEFERRYEAMPHVSKAELIEGVVYMPSPVSTEDHATPHFNLIAWLGTYQSRTPGVQGGDNGTIRLDLDNEPQPDAFLRILPECGGQSRTVGGYVEGPPELVAEVAASSVSYDLHDKLNAYRRNGVCEYLVWRVWDREIDWFVLHDGRYERLPPDADTVLRSRVFPGLWLDSQSLLTENQQRVLEILEQGLSDPLHVEFVQQLQKTRTPQT